MPENEITRVLIYRLGSIGDFVVSLPCFHLIRNHFPTAEIGLLTNYPGESRAAAAAGVLEGSGLVDQYLSYPLETRSVRVLWGLMRSIRSFDPDLLVYLANRGTFTTVFRDYLFFRLNGLTNVVGFPFKRSQRLSLPPRSDGGLWESEAHRLARCLVQLGPAETERAEGWDLRLSAQEMAEADRIIADGLKNRSSPPRLIGVSIGTKQAVKDWGEDNWRKVLEDLKSSSYGLVLIGAAQERDRSTEAARGWPGPVINLCGRTSPRVSAAAIKRTMLFLCHDSGPMHLAAAVGTRCVAVFSKHNRPGQWYPFGSGHKILYPPVDAASVMAIRPADVVAAALGILGEERLAPARSN